VYPTNPTPFGPVLDGTSTPEIVQVTNTGSSPTTAITDSLTGADPSQFRITSDNCAGNILAVSTTCTVGVIFAPTLPGELTANLTVSAANSSSAGATFSGTGNALTIDPSAFDYAGVLVGTNSPPRIFTVTNHSSTTVSPNISPIGGSQFTASSDTCIGTTLAPGAACSITVVFTPAALGPTQATLSASTTPGVTTSATLSGTGTVFAIVPAIKDYGIVPVGSSSAATFTATNAGSAALSPATFITGSGFTITSDGCTGKTVAPGASCSVVVAFAPSVTGHTYNEQLLLVVPFVDVGQATLAGAGG
jgi:hypothetical protein